MSYRESMIRQGLAQTLASLGACRRRLFMGVKAVLFVLMLVLLALIILQVFSRYILQASLPWTEEIARMVIVWAVMLAAAVATERGEHYVITVLFDQFRGALRQSILIGTSAIALVFLAVMVRAGIEYTAANMNTTYVATQLSRGWVYLALPIGASLMALSLALRTIEAFVRGRSSQQKPSTVGP
ncbi:MAG: TRAP transporter small permease [Burkholderiaceae bacterium]